jgi:hypothetical protein
MESGFDFICINSTIHYLYLKMHLVPATCLARIFHEISGLGR